MTTIAENPKRPRNSFFLHPINVLGTYEVHVGYRTSKQTILSLSANKAGARVKIPFGPICSCSHAFYDEKQVFTYTFKNRQNQTKSLPDSLLNNLLLSDNDFSRKVTSLTTGEGNKEVLAMYLSLINYSDGFVYHREGVHNTLGMKIEELEVLTKKMIDAGGSVNDLKDFICIAKNCAPVVSGIEEAIIKVDNSVQGSRKRKFDEVPCEIVTNIRERGEGGNNSNDQIDDDSDEMSVHFQNFKEQEELENPNGLEALYQASFCGCAHIPLSNISIPPQFELQKNPNRVKFIKASILKRYRPHLSILVVSPVDDSKPVDVENDKFFVVEKIQLLKAFKELDEEGKFISLKGHEKKRVLCYVLSKNLPEVFAYGNMSENFVNAQFARKIVPQDILHHFESLSLIDGVEPLKTVQRMCKLYCFRQEESTSVERFCKWDKQNFKLLMNTINVFEKYMTLDVTTNTVGVKQRISRGDKLNLSNTLFRDLSKVPQDYFVDHYSKVIDKTISLRELVTNYKDVLNMMNVLEVLSKIADNLPVKDLQRMYPGDFEFDQLKCFIGAVYDGGKKNLRAVELENYYHFIISRKDDAMYDQPVEYKYVDNVDIILKDSNVLNSFDMVIYNMKGSDMDSISSLLQTIVDSKSLFKTVFLLFSSGADHFEGLKVIRTHPGINTIRGFDNFPVMFGKKAVNDSRFAYNLVHGVLFGRFTVFKSPVLEFYSDLCHLLDIVRSICPPSAKLLMLADEGMSLIKVHDENLSWKVVYQGAKTDVELFKKTLQSDGTAVVDGVGDFSVQLNDEPMLQDELNINLEQSENQHLDESRASTSTTPSKTPKVRTSESSSPIVPCKSSTPRQNNDSGFFDPESQVVKSLTFGDISHGVK